MKVSVFTSAAAVGILLTVPFTNTFSYARDGQELGLYDRSGSEARINSIENVSILPCSPQEFELTVKVQKPKGTQLVVSLEPGVFPIGSRYLKADAAVVYGESTSGRFEDTLVKIRVPYEQFFAGAPSETLREKRQIIVNPPRGETAGLAVEFDNVIEVKDGDISKVYLENAIVVKDLKGLYIAPLELGSTADFANNLGRAIKAGGEQAQIPVDILFQAPMKDSQIARFTASLAKSKMEAKVGGTDTTVIFSVKANAEQIQAIVELSRSSLFDGMRSGR